MCVISRCFTLKTIDYNKNRYYGGEYMKLFDAVISIYRDSSEKIILADKELNFVWKNQDCLPNHICKDKIRLFYGKTFTLPAENTETGEYLGNFGDSWAVKIEPLKENDEIKGYMLHFYSCSDIELLSDRSGYLKFKSNFLGNIRLELATIVNMLDQQKPKFESIGDLDYLRFDRETRYRILKTFSATVNMNELSKYYNGFFEIRYQNISNILENISEEVCELFDDNGCMFRFDIQPAVYMSTNSERLKAVIYNLLINSFMYNDKEEKLCELSLKTDSENMIISVKDNGNGIDSETISRALIPFGNFKSFGERESLGLSLAKCYTVYFNGRLEIDSKEGQYTHINLVLPMESDKFPHDFRINHIPPLTGPYDMQYCILAKGLNPMK